MQHYLLLHARASHIRDCRCHLDPDRVDHIGHRCVDYNYIMCNVREELPRAQYCHKGMACVGRSLARGRIPEGRVTSTL